LVLIYFYWKVYFTKNQGNRIKLHRHFDAIAHKESKFGIFRQKNCTFAFLKI